MIPLIEVILYSSPGASGDGVLGLLPLFVSFCRCSEQMLIVRRHASYTPCTLRLLRLNAIFLVLDDVTHTLSTDVSQKHLYDDGRTTLWTTLPDTRRQYYPAEQTPDICVARGGPAEHLHGKHSRWRALRVRRYRLFHRCCLSAATALAREWVNAATTAGTGGGKGDVDDCKQETRKTENDKK